MKSLLSFSICFISTFNLIAQSIWSKLNYESSIKIENMYMSKIGDVALAMKDKDIIIEITKYGTELKNYEFNDVFYNPNTELYKDVFYNDKNALFIRYFIGGNHLYSIDKTNSKKILIKDYLVYLDKVKWDKNGTAYSYDFSAVSTFTSDWSKEKVIFMPVINQTSISNIFPYDELHNYIVVQSYNKYNYLYNLNRQTEKATLLWEDNLYLPRNNFIVTSSGTFIYGDNNGLYKNEGQGFVNIDFDSSVREANINLVSFDKKGNIIIQSNKDFYWSPDEGLSWTKLSKFHTDLKFTQIEVYDSSFAVALVTDQANHQSVFVNNQDNNSWNKLEINYNIRCMSNIIEANNGTLFANDDEDNGVGAGVLLKSYNQGRNWEPVEFEGKEIFSVFNKKGVLFGTSRERMFIYHPVISIDNGETWKNIEFPFKELSVFDQVILEPINDKILAFFSFTSTNKDTLIVLQSTDNGEHWNYLYNRKQSSDPKIRWRSIDKNDNIYDWTYIDLPVYVSNNYMLTHEIDHRFDSFKHLNYIYFNSDGSAFVVGSMNASFDYKLFKTTDFIHFDSLDVPFMKYFTFLNVDYYPLVFASSFDKGIWYSRDGGTSWQDYSDGLLLYPKNYSQFKDFTILQDSTAMTSICYDGLYKTSWKVNSSDLDIEPTGIFYPNPFHDILHLKYDDNIHLPFTLSIYDAQLKCIQKLQIINKDEIISIKSTIPSGILFYRLESNNRIIATGKLLKI